MQENASSLWRPLMDVNASQLGEAIGGGHPSANDPASSMSGQPPSASSQLLIDLF